MMYRISRKQRIDESFVDLHTGISKRIPTALYARLSVKKTKDESIENQVMLIENFISDSNELVLTDIYIDDGFSGTVFERPEFIRLLEDAKSGKIQCIVTKDLSRFGRNFLETGYYIETFLPKINVRLIAINDHFDSWETPEYNSITIPIKNLVNEFYARDISKKVSLYHEMAQNKGSEIIPRATYGYELDKSHNRLLVNPETAPIVKMIFRWFIMGMSTGKIAARLNAMEVLTPRAYLMKKEKQENASENELWNIAKVKDILKNQVYLGRIVLRKRKRAFYIKMAEHKTSEDEWIVHENRHEPLVTENEFEAAKKKIQNTAEKMLRKPELCGTHNVLLKGKIYCAACGKKMVYESYVYCNKRNGGHFFCKGRNLSPECANDINSGMIELKVKTQMQALIKEIMSRKSFRSDIGTDRQMLKKATVVNNKIQVIRNKIDDISHKICTLYENYFDGLITNDEYKELNTDYMKEKANLEKMYCDTEKQRIIAHNQQMPFMELCDIVKGHANEQEFKPELVESLIERINVSKNGTVDIIYKCDDIVHML